MDDSHFRPDLPSSALPLEGCLLLQRIARSYGASHTQRLCRSLLESSLLTLSFPMPNDFLRRTYLNIHSPTIVCAMAPTTPVPPACELAFDWKPVASVVAVFVEGW
jgi:hypothetical protein